MVTSFGGKQNLLLLPVNQSKITPKQSETNSLEIIKLLIKWIGLADAWINYLVLSVPLLCISSDDKEPFFFSQGRILIFCDELCLQGSTQISSYSSICSISPTLFPLKIRLSVNNKYSDFDFRKDSPGETAIESEKRESQCRDNIVGQLPRWEIWII